MVPGLSRWSFQPATTLTIAHTVLGSLAERTTILLSVWKESAREAELGAAWWRGKETAGSKPVRRGSATSLQAAGIQAGCRFFGLIMPSQQRLTLELFYEDGRVEYE